MARFAHLIFVCTHRRDPQDPRGDCTGRGSDALLRALKACAARKPAASRVRVVSCGCLNLCAQGCAVVVFSAPGCGPAETWYCRLDAASAADMFACHIEQQRPWQPEASAPLPPAAD